MEFNLHNHAQILDLLQLLAHIHQPNTAFEINFPDDEDDEDDDDNENEDNEDDANENMEDDFEQGDGDHEMEGETPNNDHNDLD